MERIVVADPGDLAVAAADMVADEIASHPDVMLGLAGGSTPRPCHDVLTSRDLDWARVTAWIADERWVPPDDPQSNQAMVRASLTDPSRILFIAPDTTMSTPADAAASYAENVVPRITDPHSRTVLMLGMGADGHTASLFPRTRALDVTSPSFVANFVPQLDAWRITATFPLIASADTVIFLVAGAGKADTIADIAAGADYPAARVTARERVVWLLDEAAASQIA